MENGLPKLTMKLESESSTLPEELSKKGKTSDLSGTLPGDGIKLKEAPTDFWQAIRTIIGLQKQAPPLQPVSRNGNLPLSFPQERLWLLDQLAPGSSSYNIPMTFRVTGSLNVTALEQSLNEIVRRHEALRTTFAVVDGQPVQVIAPALTLTISVVDLRELPKNKGDQTLQLVTEEAQRSFNLSQGPLLRATLLHIKEDEHLVILTVHHIVFDAWSAYSVLFKELAVLYEAFSTGKPNTLPELPIQYADYAVWQRQWLQGEFLETLLSYWKRQLGGSIRMQRLPTDRPRPSGQICRSACQTLVISATLTEALKALSRREGATLFTTLLAAFKILLHSYTNQDDLFVCTPTANRNRTETKGLIGYLVNLLVLRTDLSGDPSFRELLSRMRKETSASYAHQDLPVQRLMDCLNLVHTPLSQVMFVLQNIPRQPVELSGLTVSPMEIVDNGMADFDLSLTMVEEAENLTGVWKYNSELFYDATITGMLKQFQLLLESIVGNPEQPLSSLPLLAETEWHRQAKLPNGNMDGGALPAFDQGRLELERAYPSRNPTLREGLRSTVYVAPVAMLEVQLTKIWEEVLGIQPIGTRDNFFELGGHSLLALHLFGQIEKMSGKNLPLATLFQAPTIEQQASIIYHEEWSACWSPLVPIQTGGEKPPFFGIHGAYGNVLFYDNLARHLNPEQPVYGLQPQGLDGKQVPHTRVEDMAADYIREIRTIQPQGPYFLGGYSMGGKVAFEMAQQLHAQGDKVALLALFDTLGSEFLKPLPYRVRASRHLGNFLRLDLKEKLTYVKERWGRRFYSDNTPPLPEACYESPLHEAHMQANRDYVPQVYAGRAILFRVTEPVEEWLEWHSVDPQLGWGRVVAGGLETYEIPGNHLNMFNEPYVQVLAEKLQACLEQAQADN